MNLLSMLKGLVGERVGKEASERAGEGVRGRGEGVYSVCAWP